MLRAIFCAIILIIGTNGNDAVIGILGNSVSIDCKLPGTDNLVWETSSTGIIAINGELLTGNRLKYVLEKYGGVQESLIIHNVTLADETEYRCYDAHNVQRSYITKLNVLGKRLPRCSSSSSSPSSYSPSFSSSSSSSCPKMPSLESSKLNLVQPYITGVDP